MASELQSAARKVREWTLRRDALIRSERDSGKTLRDIGAQAGLSHSAIAKILGRH